MSVLVCLIFIFYALICCHILNWHSANNLCLYTFTSSVCRFQESTSHWRCLQVYLFVVACYFLHHLTFPKVSFKTNFFIDFFSSFCCGWNIRHWTAPTTLWYNWKISLNLYKRLVCACANVCVYEFSEYVFVCIEYFLIGNVASFLLWKGIINLFVIFWQFFKILAVFLRSRNFIAAPDIYDSVSRNDVNWVKLTLWMSATDRKLKLFKGNKMMWKFGVQTNSLVLLLLIFFYCLMFLCSTFIIRKRSWIHALHSQATKAISNRW